jgi:hypothetical protein
MEAMKSPEVFIEHYLTKEYTDTGKIEQIQRNIAHLREQKMNTEMSITRIESAYESGNYSEEKMAEKVAEKNTEIVKIEEEIQRQEDELSFISSVDIETQKLKSASEQVKYRLEKLTRKQKKILCNLFVDRVEMYRKKKGQEWEVSAEIYFRFNPEKFTNPTQGGRTQKELEKDKKDSLKSQKVKGGESGGNGYFQFHFSVELKKKQYIRGTGAKRKYIEEVVLKERKPYVNKRSLSVSNYREKGALHSHKVEVN